MKNICKVICIILCFLSLFTACGTNSDSASRTEPEEQRVVLTADNFDDYFFSEINYDFKTHTSGFGTTYFSNTITIELNSKRTAVFENIVVEGKLHLDVEPSHLLYTQGKIPIDVTIQIDGNGYGKEIVSYTHGTGSYGGFEYDDFYFVAENVSGSVVLK